MKTAMARPRVLGSSNMSAYTPGAMVIIEEAKVPAKKRKPKKVLQLGARAQPKVESVKQVLVHHGIHLRPYVSLSGPHTIGPQT